MLKPGEKVALFTNRVTLYGPGLNATSFPAALRHFVNGFYLCFTHELNGSVVSHSAFDGANPLFTWQCQRPRACLSCSARTCMRKPRTLLRVQEGKVHDFAWEGGKRREECV
jgi:hypothetical protein